MKQPTAIIIGAGIGGITAATHLARRGWRVTVVEKNGRPGGRCDYFIRDGHRFDTGPTLFIMPRVFEAEFAALGASLHEMLALQRVDPSYHLVFDDGRQLTLTADLKSMCEQLEAIEPGSFQGYLRYIEEGHRHYHLAMERLVNRDFRTATQFFSLRNLSLLPGLKPLVPHYRNMASYFAPAPEGGLHLPGRLHGAEPFRGPGDLFDDALHRAGPRGVVSQRGHVPDRGGARRACPPGRGGVHL